YHHTFFEMLGNWSFGDYFKAEAIAWAWQLLTELWGLPKDRLYATVFAGDEKEGLERDTAAERLWKEVTDIDPSHVLLGGRKDNFWEMGETGPCGPCSEIHIDLTEDASGAKLVNADDGRVIELWNLVFMQYNRDEAGRLTPLLARHVDTGLGLERVVAVLQGKRSAYATDLFVPIIEKIETLTDHRYGSASGLKDRFDVISEDDIGDVACRVVADHARALTFAIADGVIPSNEGRGYVLRRILRRAARYGRQYLKIDGPFLARLAPVVVELMGDFFGELRERQQYIVETIAAEEESFGKTLDRGIELFQRTMINAIGWQMADQQGETTFEAELKAMTGKRTKEWPGHWVFRVGDKEYALENEDDPRQFIKDHCGRPPKIPGSAAFELYATYGFPIDLTQLMARERGLEVDIAGYDEAMARHRELSGAGAAFKAADIPDLPATDDSAKYGREPIEAKVLGWVVDSKFVAKGSLAAGDAAAVVLDKTNFYGEAGGQVGDAGVLSYKGGRFAVRDTVQAGSAVLHIGVVETGTL
ncbi:MAG: alanine--tRNA ligase, partial [Phycisphaerae bacterium]|nr:alanine--tRNA ligase [Phycisphaerae bacterium]